jgi:hypothetical protein
VSAEQPVTRLEQTLRAHPEQVLASWAHRFDRSPLRFVRAAPREYAAMVSSMVESLATGLPPPGSESDLHPGAASVRELEKAVTFAGASFAASGASGFDAAALILCLRDALLEFADDALAAPLTGLFEWLAIVALDGHGKACVATVRERAVEHLERGTPVVLVTPELPAVLLVGEPDSATLDSILGRLALLVVRVGASTVIVDATGLADPAAAPVVAALERFAGHEVVAGKVEIAAVGLHDESRTAWAAVADRAGARLVTRESFEQAVAAALRGRRA